MRPTYPGRSLAADVYGGFRMRPVRARPVVQPVASSPVRSYMDELEHAEDALEYHWSDGQRRVRSLVASRDVKRER